jgi:nucleoside-diphosphate kinase
MAEEPRQRKDPASNEKQQAQARRTAENLAPRFFALLFALLAIYILFSPPSSSLSPPVNLSSASTSYSVPSSQVIPDKNIAKMSSSEQT